MGVLKQNTLVDEELKLITDELAMTIAENEDFRNKYHETNLDLEERIDELFVNYSELLMSKARLILLNEHRAANILPFNPEFRH